MARRSSREEPPKQKRRGETRPVGANSISRHLVSLASTLRVRVRRALAERGHQQSFSTSQVIPNLPVDGLGMTELAARLKHTLQRTGQLVQQLEADGYVERIPDPDDGRAKRVVYTDRGLELVRDIDEIMATLTEEFEGMLGSDRLARLRSDLAALDEAINGPDAPLRIPRG